MEYGRGNPANTDLRTTVELGRMTIRHMLWTIMLAALIGVALIVHELLEGDENAKLPGLNGADMPVPKDRRPRTKGQPSGKVQAEQDAHGSHD